MTFQEGLMFLATVFWWQAVDLRFVILYWLAIAIVIVAKWFFKF